MVGLSMPLPLFDRNQGNVLAAARRADQARDLRNAVALRLRSETRSAISQWEAAMQDVEAYDRTILLLRSRPWTPPPAVLKWVSSLSSMYSTPSAR